MASLEELKSTIERINAQFRAEETLFEDFFRLLEVLQPDVLLAFSADLAPSLDSSPRPSNLQHHDYLLRA